MRSLFGVLERPLLLLPPYVDRLDLGRLAGLGSSAGDTATHSSRRCSPLRVDGWPLPNSISVPCSPSSNPQPLTSLRSRPRAALRPGDAEVISACRRCIRPSAGLRWSRLRGPHRHFDFPDARRRDHFDFRRLDLLIVASTNPKYTADTSSKCLPLILTVSPPSDEPFFGFLSFSTTGGSPSGPVMKFLFSPSPARAYRRRVERDDAHEVCRYRESRPVTFAPTLTYFHLRRADCCMVATWPSAGVVPYSK